MSGKFQDYLKTGRGKLTVALGAMGLSWLFLLWMFSDSLGALIPSSERLPAVQKELKLLQQENTALQARRKAADAVRERYRTQIAECWREERDGVVETELRNKIQQAAHAAELKLDTLGSVRTTRINNDLYYAEIDISTAGTLETLIRFLGKIRESKPELAWRRLDLRPENMRDATATNLMFSGAIRVIGFDGKPDATLQPGGKK